MHDAILLRCTHCRETIRLVIYEQSHVHQPSDWPDSVRGWLNDHAAHHPRIAAHEYDLGDDPGFEVITLNRLMRERGAPHEPAVKVNEY